MKKILEGKWDCSQCGQTGIRGREKSCPGCGDPRDPVNDPSEEPYLTADAEDITHTPLAAELGEKPDWICDHCGQANHSDATSCRGCGQAHDTPDATVPTRVWSGIRNVIPKQIRAKAASLGDLPITKERTRGVTIVASAVALFLALFWGIWAIFFATHTVQLTVVDTDWQRGVEVEEYRTLQKEDFSPPGDARIHDSFRAVHHYDHVQTGTRTETYTEQVPYTSTETYSDCSTVSNGNGTFTQQCVPRTRTVTNYRSETRTRQVPTYTDVPVYRTKYRYEIDRWVTDFFYTVDEDDSTNPFWPENIPPADEPNHRVGDERQQEYRVTLADDDKQHVRKVEFKDWRSAAVGEVVTANVNRQGKIRSVEWEAA